jgi:glycosyltransferase involved in cell wall biosynthesis
MRKAVVSCIVPVYNGARYLPAALASIFAQDYPALEIILVDDGSTDGTAEIARAYGSKLTYVYQANAGVCAARMTGMATAGGAWFAFLDADDLWEPRKLSLQMERFRSLPDLGISFTLIKNFWSEDVPPQECNADPSLTRAVPGFVFPTMLVRQDVFGRVGPFDPALVHTSEPAWILRAMEAGVEIDLLAEVLVLRRLHPDSTSHRNAAEAQDEYLRLLKHWLDHKRKLAAAPVPTAAGKPSR